MLSTTLPKYPGDSADAKGDSTDATRGYPEDSTDGTSNKVTNNFLIARVSRVPLAPSPKAG